ncbi:hypothetical protein AB0454_43090 [Streptomyces sp. NPDC093509]|uniref:hypothetical protein n=1 Tax=Streptomyces sp. NPDC093509 TaxID=3154982 RepID=UPI00344C41A1
MSTASLQLTSDPAAAATTATGVVAVVAPYGTGSHYRAEVAAKGWDCVAVTTPEDQLPPMYRGHLDATGYRQVVVHNGDLQATTRTLASLRVTAIVAGTEIGVPLAEVLAHRLHLPGNDPRTSDLRRDKGAMAAALQRAGLDAPRSLSTDRLREALAWAAQQDCEEFVLKPADSGGSDGVFFCTSPDDIKAAWTQLHGIPNALGGDNTHLIVQERLRGMQHVVNSVSAVDAGGTPRHTFTEIWADHRIGHVYDRLDLRRPNRLVPKILAEYTARVLDVLGITTGPAHTEVMYARRRGPVLIETGNRPEGSYPVAAMRAATDSDHIRDAVHAAITGRPERLSHPDPSTFVTKVSLISPGDGALDEDRLQMLLKLPTVRGHVGALTAGTRVTRTVDLLTSPGRLLLASDDAHAITKDHAAIRQLEKDGLYSGDPR